MGLALAWIIALSTAACGGKGANDRDNPAPLPEQGWLDRVGTGSSQTAKVCANGARDRVAQALCDPAAGGISGLEQLYGALRLAAPESRRLAATTHSLSLSGRSVSAANPRVLVLANNDIPGGLSYEGVVATAFVRGEQFVELVGLDPVTYEYNFYLLRFTQACNNSRCTTEDLLSQRVESEWTGWTLYADRDLEDTPFDCLSCHRPFGEGTHKLLLMRQVLDPWMHWSDFRSLDESQCPTPPPDGATSEVIATSDGLDLVAQLAGEQEKYAGVPLEALLVTKSGDVLSDFMVDAENLIADSPLPPHPYAQMSLRTRETLCERFYTGESPSWERDRLASRARGLPFPYFGPEVLGSAARSELLADPANFWASRREDDPFDVLTSLLSGDVPAAVGFEPRESDSAPDILRGMCGRCHAADTNPTLLRSRFNAEATDSIEPSTFHEVRARLALPPTSPGAMPPRRTGRLPSWAIERVLDYLASRCAAPAGCR